MSEEEEFLGLSTTKPQLGVSHYLLVPEDAA
jgi:hypothetical protein